jgi:hypothetical protein
MPPSPGQARGSDARAAPRIDTVAANAPRTGDTAACPMPLESPSAQGFKRTADGSLKGEGSAVQTPSGPTPTQAHKRNKSMDTHRIGEVRNFGWGLSLQFANAYAAFRPTEDASIVCHGQGAKWMGKAIARCT